VKDVDEGIRRWWTAVKAGPNSYFTEQWDAQLQALGPAALERTLDCIDGRATLDIPRQGAMEYRDLANWEQIAIIAFARADAGRVLSRLAARGWSDIKIAQYLGAVPDPAILPYVLALLASKQAIERSTAVNYLGAYRDGEATTALLGALNDRSSFVRFSAIERLADAGDPSAIPPLERFAAEVAGSKRFGYLAASAKAAIDKIRAK
jgi:hypothetical protein